MMHSHKQRGMTFVGLILLLAIGGAIVLVLLKVTPMYIESFQVDSAMQNIVNDPDAGKLSKREIYDKFLRHMEVNDIRRFSEKDLAKMMTIERDRGRLKLSMKYQTERRLFDNLAVVAYWDKEVP